MLINSLLKNKKVIKSSKFNEDIIDLTSMTYKIPESFEFQIFTVNKMHIGRPDLISKILYGSDQYGDLICKLNGISNPFELNEGNVILVPSYAYISDFMITDDFDDSIDDQKDPSSNTPKPKNRKEKRKANEAVIGDKRYKIDKNNKVIIY